MLSEILNMLIISSLNINDIFLGDEFSLISRLCFIHLRLYGQLFAYYFAVVFEQID